MFNDRTGMGVQDDLRRQIADRLVEQREEIAADSVGILRFSGPETVDDDYCRRVAHAVIDLIAAAVRDARVDSTSGLVMATCGLVAERGLATDRLFTFVYLIERTVVDELAIDETLGATTESWPLVAQMIRRGSFDLLAACAERVRLEPSDGAIVDRLTTLYTWPLFEAVMTKEMERASRFGEPLALILFDIDNLSAINREYGYGVGDRVLERVGILLRKYFRQHDWVARQNEDGIAVLLSRTDPEWAVDLAERARRTVEERLEFHDHHTDRTVLVTVSAAVLTVVMPTGAALDAERLMVDAIAAVERIKLRGGNAVERVDIRAIPPAAV